MVDIATRYSEPNSSTMTAFSRTIGRRQPPPVGALRAPCAEERAWIEVMARQRTRVPKGVFRYRSHAEANADWERWQVDAIVADRVRHE